VAAAGCSGLNVVLSLSYQPVGSTGTHLLGAETVAANSGRSTQAIRHTSGRRLRVPSGLTGRARVVGLAAKSRPVRLCTNPHEIAAASIDSHCSTGYAGASETVTKAWHRSSGGPSAARSAYGRGWGPGLEWRPCTDNNRLHASQEGRICPESD